jgi:hypothetical protein
MGYFGQPTLASPLSWNMLCHEMDSVGQGTWSRASSSGAFSGTLSNSPSVNGDNFSVKVRVPKGTYRLRFNAPRFPSAGIVAVDVDGVEKGRFDLYRSSAANYNVAEIAGLQLGGEHEIRFRVDGKNAASTGYTFRSNEMSLVRTGPPVEGTTISCSMTEAT